jgi:protein O-GlcNAc transferase
MSPSAKLLQRAAALFEARRLDEAAEICERLLSASPPQGDVAHLAGLVAFERGERARGVALLRQALSAGVRHPALHANLAACLVSVGEVSAALEHAGAALALAPTWAPANAGMAEALLAQGAVGEAVAHLRAARELDPSPALHANILYALNFLPGYSPKDLLAEHRAFGRAHAAPVYRLAGHANDPDPERRLRVGYLSADMYSHSVAHFLAPLLEAHDRGAVLVHGFPSVKRPDAVTERLRGLCDAWTPVLGLSDDQVAMAVRAAGIDVLVELGGHTGDSRLLVLARRPAPVQVSWLGYPNTTGIEAVGHRLTDAWVDPEGEADKHHVESLVRLPSGFFCYEPPAGAPDVAPPPAEARGGVTFGSFNTLAKMTPKVVELWARLLRKAPGSRLLLKAGPLADAGVRDRITRRFVEQGVEASRLALEGRTPGQLAHLARYAEVDIALDPFPYNGTTTTCEALWMGVPVIALEGDRHAARVSAGILRRVGLDPLVAGTPKQYQALALELARRPARLAELRASLRARLSSSPLLDRAGFARGVESAYRALWRAWCRAIAAEPPPAPIGKGGVA